MTMTPDGQGSIVQTTTNEIQVDHRLLGELLARIEIADQIAGACSLLAELRGYLLGHFEAEMREDGFFDQVLERAPWRAGVIEDLRREHRTVIVEIDRIHARLSTRPPPPDPFRADLVSLVETLRDHESREGALACEILEAELGDCD